MPKQNQILATLSLSSTLFQASLGDGSLQKNTSKTVLKYRIKFLQGKLSKHADYLRHLHTLFKDFVIVEPYHDPKRNTLPFCTVFHQAFNPLAPIFFNDSGRKEITDYFKHNCLSAISLAYWYMDDGGLLSYNKDYPRRAMVFNCQAFSKKECLQLSYNINRGHDLQSWVKADKAYYCIVIPAKRADYLREIIIPYIIDSMKHKLKVVQSKTL